MRRLTEPVQISLDLRRHCVETEIRRVYNRSLSDYFKADAERKSALEPRIALLEKALQTLDFNFLRSTYPPLAGGSAAEVELGSGSEGNPKLQINGKTIV